MTRNRQKDIDNSQTRKRLEKEDDKRYTAEYIRSLVEVDEQRNLRLYRERVKHINFKN